MNERPEWANPYRDDGQRLDFDYLGGTSTGGDPDSWFPELWDWLSREFQVLSCLDVGCGVGVAMTWWLKHSLAHVCGMDCQQVLAHHLLRGRPDVRDDIFSHDLTTRHWLTPPTIGVCDLVWCCEVAEHIEEKFVGNLIRTLAQNTDKVLAFCAAPRGAGGYHHVNCQNPPYWIGLLSEAGLRYRQDLTEHARQLCPAGYGRGPRNYFARSGLIFTKK
jgi:hypothetical protein